MKSSTVLSIILLSAFIASTTAKLVLDVDGEPVENNVAAYYLMPDLMGKGGGIERVRTGKETCPLTVVQSPFEVVNGLPVKIASSLRSYFIPEDSKVRIGFSSSPECASNPWWTVVEGLPEGPAVKISGGYESTVEGWFKIMSVSSSPKLNNYKLMFCAREDDSCENIGIHKDAKGNRRLVVTDKNPMVIQFVKVASSSA
ncbi:trypsin inhibitor 1A [Cajanus cajan]|uniref:Trypsin inhibitor 1A n=1 Tax=Cajanus cajan TaxID=3821 RepID=A0A151SYZ1_CAJCA|nr:trypsin inhibitor 1A [Cajanus cajan]KYP60029.1 Trypsin inhibitor 1A [Cajanus cajan]